MPPHLRILTPHPGIFAYYDGRVPGYRFDPRKNWVDEGALSVGIASFALVQGAEALVYDTGTTLLHGQAVVAHLAGMGVRKLRVILSHWHKDHVAGTAAFAGAEVIASARTLAHLQARQAGIEAGTTWPPINPLILPKTTYRGAMSLTLGDQRVDLIEMNIHSDDATVLWLPDRRILLAGDTLEDTVTYLAEPEGLAVHLTDLARLADLTPAHILPCHGDPDVIAQGGYGPGLIGATQRYVAFLSSLRDHPDRADTPLRTLIADDLAAGNLHWFDAYAVVHAENLALVLQHNAS
jgi:glyoxylase-like metal-dependent hydrolase (beta-lactamase superfamily II)